jgi:antitoxin VapB
MKTAKLFSNGRSQAVRLPKEYRLPGKDAYIRKFDNIILLFPKRDAWVPFIKSLDKFSEDFLSERIQPSLHPRERFE